MSESLFRDEAVRELSANHLDARRLDIPGYLPVLALLLFTVVMSVGWLIASLEYGRKHLVTGQLDETNTDTLHATDFGYVKRLLVREGDPVEQGQLLGEVAMRDDARNTASTLELNKRLSQLENTIKESRNTFLRQLEAAEAHARRLSIRSSIVRQNLALQSDKVTQLEKQVVRSASLHKQGYLSNLDWLNFRTGLTNEKQHHLRLQDEYVELDQQRRNAETRQAVLQSEQKTHLLQLELQLSEVRESLTRFSSGPSQLLIANRAGVVSRIETPNRNSVTPGQPVLYISSEEQSNSGTLLVPPTAAGHIQAGDTLSLELQAYPMETFGHVDAVIDQIPKHTIMAGQLPVYPVRISIQPSSRIHVYLPGMTFTGYVLAEKKRIGQWVSGPLNRTFELFK
ncbi:MAG: HlyD family efflux transporter periplasmic adaptor subunit [Pseudomonadales bacterium]|nr:HlyD family efflux transporter periplasmic adaptor subunit [Pseudomonadales bacterium]MBO6595201.1 HlyD family efflux transporter periplasmic adaptor subunit [Pseudomonadales bacterium]MBO6821240.1 HlyD family efflux transporter periplasmic adaptor subunit [Pseudomonadales bacterium]